jgi:hypothetical protein
MPQPPRYPARKMGFGLMDRNCLLCPTRGLYADAHSEESRLADSSLKDEG